MENQITSFLSNNLLLYVNLFNFKIINYYNNVLCLLLFLDFPIHHHFRFLFNIIIVVVVVVIPHTLHFPSYFQNEKASIITTFRSLSSTFNFIWLNIISVCYFLLKKKNHVSVFSLCVGKQNKKYPSSTSTLMAMKTKYIKLLIEKYFKSRQKKKVKFNFMPGTFS